MHFTREPIIETIITPKDGYKLIVRNTKLDVQDEYQLDALEIVSFNNILFYRSQERPSCFLLPVSDYEVVEEKEARVGLKSVHLEKTIKIGGGRENPPSKNREPERKEAPLPVEESSEGRDKKKERNKRHRRRGNNDERRNQWRTEGQDEASNQQMQADQIEELESSDEKEETEPMPAFAPLIPPPKMLISDTMSRYKDAPFMDARRRETEEKVEESKPQEVETTVIELETPTEPQYSEEDS